MFFYQSGMSTEAVPLRVNRCKDRGSIMEELSNAAKNKTAGQFLLRGGNDRRMEKNRLKSLRHILEMEKRRGALSER